MATGMTLEFFFRLFVDSEKLSDEVRTHLKRENVSVTLLPYTDIATHLSNLVCQGAGGTEKIWVLFCCTIFFQFVISSVCR